MKSIEWLGDRVRLIDQTKLPLHEIYLDTNDYKVLADAIRSLKIRGAPAIGIAAAYGIVLAAITSSDDSLKTFESRLQHAFDELASTRPTAVNLFWSLRRMRRVFEAAGSADAARRALLQEAIKIHLEDEEMCKCIGERGATIVPQVATILTHCNTGALATGGDGTAQNVITTAHRQGKSVKVYATETRPALQGARLTTWELMHAGVDVTLITDGAASFLMLQKHIDLVVVGADRIAANGDTVNKIGTYNLAVSAKHHRIPFYIAAPSSTVDTTLQSGWEIPIEERSPREVIEGFGVPTAPYGVNVCAPAFDITPAELITAIITEQGVHYPPFNFHLAATFAK